MTGRPGFRRSSTGGRAPTSPSNGEQQPPSESLTTLGAPFTHAQILHLMKTEFARARRLGYPLTILLVQVDDLVSHIETHGPEFREDMRSKMAGLVAEKTRDYDLLGLMSEDRFLVLLPHTDGEQGLAIAQRIRAGFPQAGLRAATTASVGVSSCEDRDTLFFDTVVSQAEVALEWAMEEGGNAAVLFERNRFLGP